MHFADGGMGGAGYAGAVGDENDYFVIFDGEVVEDLEDFGFGAVVEVAGGFVGDYYWRVASDGAGDCNALLLATGEFLD